MGAWDAAIGGFAAELGRRPIASATAEGYLKHVGWLADAGLAEDPWEVSSRALAAWLDGHHWSFHTRRKALVSIGQFYAWGVATGRVEWSPTAGIPRRAARTPGPSRRPWPPAWVEPVDGYLKSLHATGMTRGTMDQYLIRLQMLAGLAPDPWRITLPHLEQWLSNPDWSAQTKRSSKIAVRSFYRWAVRVGHLAESPAAELGVIRVPRALPRPAPDQAVREALAAGDDRVRLAVMFAAYAGLRRSEIAGLRVEDVTDAQVRVQGKGGHQRIVPVDPDGPLGTEWRAEMARRRRLEVIDNGWLFPSSQGGHLTPHHLGKLITRVLPGGYTTHQLRHRFATAAYAGERDLMAVQQLLGHSKPETTAVYARVPDGALLTAVQAASRLR
jgi:site-specific recombinase XerD